jgi:hypothetical protein
MTRSTQGLTRPRKTSNKAMAAGRRARARGRARGVRGLGRRVENSWRLCTREVRAWGGTGPRERDHRAHGGEALAAQEAGRPTRPLPMCVPAVLGEDREGKLRRRGCCLADCRAGCPRSGGRPVARLPLRSPCPCSCRPTCAPPRCQSSAQRRQGPKSEGAVDV